MKIIMTCFIPIKQKKEICYGLKTFLFFLFNLVIVESYLLSTD